MEETEPEIGKAEDKETKLQGETWGRWGSAGRHQGYLRWAGWGQGRRPEGGMETFGRPSQPLGRLDSSLESPPL